MQNLFELSETIPRGFGFKPFSAEHLLRILGGGVFIAIVVLIYKKLKSYRHRRIMRRSFAVALLLLPLLKTALYIARGALSAQTMPFMLAELCSFVAFARTMKDSDFYNEILYALGLPAGVLAMFVPAATNLPPINLMYFYNLCLPVLLAAFVAMPLFAGEFVARIKNLLRVAATGLFVCAIMYVYDRLTGANFLWLNYPPQGVVLSSFANYLGKPGYLIGLAIVVLVIWEVMYLPFVIREKKERAPRSGEKKQESEIK